MGSIGVDSSTRTRMAIALLGMAMAGCTAIAGQDGDPTALATECPMIDSRNWTANMAQEASTGSGLVLQVNGEADLPTPGYKASLAMGPLDRRNPPGLRLRLSFVAPDGPVIQVIDTQMLTFDLPTKISQYREVRVVCGNQELAVIKNVEASK